MQLSHRSSVDAVLRTNLRLTEGVAPVDGLRAASAKDLSLPTYSTYLSISIYIYIDLSISIYMYICMYPSIYRSIDRSIYLSCLSVYPSICLCTCIYWFASLDHMFFKPDALLPLGLGAFTDKSKHLERTAVERQP